MTTKAQGHLFIISAPSGTGKTSLVQALVNICDNVIISVSHTTRKKRPGEVDGKHYHFVTHQQFKSMITQGVFLEYACIYHHLYGTSRCWVEKILKSAANVILEIDWQGAKQVLVQFPSAISIFILPPSKQALRHRLQQREQGNDVNIQQRLATVTQEVKHCYDFDYILVNDDFDTALGQLKKIIMYQKAANIKKSQHLSRLIQSIMTS